MILQHDPEFCAVCRRARNDRVERRKNRWLALLGLVMLPFCMLLDLVQAIVAAHVDTFIEWHGFARSLWACLKTGRLP